MMKLCFYMDFMHKFDIDFKCGIFVFKRIYKITLLILRLDIAFAGIFL